MFDKVKCGQNKTGAIQPRTSTKIRASEVGSSAIDRSVLHDKVNFSIYALM